MKKYVLLIILMSLLAFTQKAWAQELMGSGFRDSELPCLPSHGWYDDITAWCGEESVTQTIALSAGTNWFSTYLDITLDDLKAALVAVAAPNTTITIKNATQSVVYSRGHWNGTLDLDIAKKYNINMASACEIALEGMPLIPAEHPVTVVGGGMVTWIGFPLGESMTLTNAFAGFAQNGDIVKTQYGNALYTRGHWNGEFSLEPGKGYLYISAEDATDRVLVYPSSAK